MTIMTEKHYRDMISNNPGATIGFVLAARAVYTTRYGCYDTADGSTQRFRDIALQLADRYGEALTTNELKLEMDEFK